MKKSSLITVALASLVALVGCNKGGKSQPKEKYPLERSYAEEVVTAFFPDEAEELIKEFLETGDEVVDQGQDPETGETVYGPGAAFGVVMWDSQDAATGEVNLVGLQQMIGTIGYNVVDEEYAAPDIASVVDEHQMVNVTATMYGTDAFNRKEGGEAYAYLYYDLYAPLVEEPQSAADYLYLGVQLGAAYLQVDEDENYILVSAELFCLHVTRENLSVAFSNPTFIDKITRNGYFDPDADTINITEISVSVQLL